SRLINARIDRILQLVSTATLARNQSLVEGLPIWTHSFDQHTRPMCTLLRLTHHRWFERRHRCGRCPLQCRTLRPPLRRAAIGAPYHPHPRPRSVSAVLSRSSLLFYDL